jgi:DNA polymerase IV
MIMTLKCLFVDFNSFFASVEQYDEPRLRGRPVAVVPVMAPTTCCIAASYEAKSTGIKTGTPVWEALQLCPELVVIQARPARYVQLHHQLMAAIQHCIPHGKPESIDEVPCWLIGRERQRDNAEKIAHTIKQEFIQRGFSPAIRCSIGIAPNKFLAKTASDMQKPDGLTILELNDLPRALHTLELRDLCGIGPNMEYRLNAGGIFTVEQLCNASSKQLRTIWHSLEGERFWMLLRGIDVPERKTNRSSIGHSHVLNPELRTYEGARSVLFKLLAKAAMRLRHEEFLASALSIRMKFVGTPLRFERDLNFAPMCDTPSLLHLLGEQLQAISRAIEKRRWNIRQHPPLSVAVTLHGLVQGIEVSKSLLSEKNRSRNISSVLDKVNQRFGNNSVYFGAMQNALSKNAAPMRIPFSKIPDTGLEDDVGKNSNSENMDMSNPAYELWLKRENQFKVLAEDSHKKHQQQRDAKRRKFIAAAQNAGEQSQQTQQLTLWS